jgi:hypothetical protein
LLEYLRSARGRKNFQTPVQGVRGSIAIDFLRWLARRIYSRLSMPEMWAQTTLLCLKIRMFLLDFAGTGPL